MMIDSSTSWRNVCAIHVIVGDVPALIASGRLTNARSANAYAHHIVPTTAVILRARNVLKRVRGPPPVGCWSATRGGCWVLQRSMCGCRTYWKLFGISHDRIRLPGWGGSRGAWLRSDSQVPASGQ